MEVQVVVRGILEGMKNIPRQVIIKPIIIIFLIWGLVFLGLIQFKVPYNLYVQLSKNPWYPINAETYPEYGVSAIDFANSTHGWIGGENGLIMVTNDGGQSWKEQQSGITTTIEAIDFFNATIGVAISKTNEILITHTGGETWYLLEYARTPNREVGILWDMVTCDEETAWVIGSGGSIFRINILHMNWTFISETSLCLFRLFMVNNSHGWAVGCYGNIVHTQDGWQTFEDQSLETSKTFFGVFFWNHNKGWVVGDDNTILATSNGGKYWWVQYSYRPLLGGTSLLDIFFITELQGWAVGTWGIHFTENGGASWFHFSNTSGPHRITFVNRTHGWAIDARKERSYMTTIGGTLPISESTINFGIFVITLSGALTSVLVVNVIMRLIAIEEKKYLDRNSP